MTFRRLLLTIAVATALLAAATASGSTSTPPTSSVTVPTSAGATVTDSWTGTIPPGTNPTSSCAALPAALVDEHVVTINVPANTYDTIDAAFKFSITWADAANDEILTVLDPAGDPVGSSDGSSNVET